MILGDIDILKNAPLHMLKSGLGDMLAKYISLCEWKIAQLLIGEYYCETVAELIRIEKLKIGEGPVIVNAETFVIVDAQGKNPVPQNVIEVTNAGSGKYIIKTATATIETTIVEKEFTSWEVSYHAAEPAE